MNYKTSNLVEPAVSGAADVALGRWPRSVTQPGPNGPAQDAIRESQGGSHGVASIGATHSQRYRRGTFQHSFYSVVESEKRTM